MLPNTLLAQLDQYSFHDLPITSIQFTSGEGLRMLITATPYNEVAEAYSVLHLKFSGISALQMDTVTLFEDSEFEMYRFDYRYDTCFECEMLFLTGFGKPGFTIKLSCSAIMREEE